MFWLLAALACSTPSAGTSSPTTPTALNARSDIDIDRFAAVVEKGGADVLDVRTPEEFATGHVPGARNVPIEGLDPADPVLQSHDRAQPLYVICASGNRSSKAADELASAGFVTVNVQGGTRAWTAKGLPVE